MIQHQLLKLENGWHQERLSFHQTKASGIPYPRDFDVHGPFWSFGIYVPCEQAHQKLFRETFRKNSKRIPQCRTHYLYDLRQPSGVSIAGKTILSSNTDEDWKQSYLIESYIDFPRKILNVQFNFKLDSRSEAAC